MTSYVVVLVTVPSFKEAQKMTESLLKDKWAACVNIIKGVHSLYWWKGKVEKGREVLLIIKSQKSKVPGMVRFIKKGHSYSVPEVIALPILSGNADYLKWIGNSVKGTKKRS